MTPCPDPGIWRAHLDGETAVAGPDEHLATCADCARTVAELRSDSSFTRSRMAVLDRPVVQRSIVPATVPRAPRTWGWLKGVAAAAVIAVFMATPVGQDAAHAFLSSFRVRQFNLVQVTMTEAAQVADTLWSLGTIEGDELMLPDFNALTVAEAEATTGLEVPTPASLVDEPAVAYVIPASQVHWTLDAAMIAAYLEAEGSDLVVPDGIDGTTVVFDRADAVAVVYGESVTLPDLVVGVSGPIGASTEGLPMDQVRAFLLELPGIPDALTAQLAAVDDWQSTLPIPVPVEEGSAREVELGSVTAVRFDVQGFGSGYFWVDGDNVVGVASAPGYRGLETVATEMAG